MFMFSEEKRDAGNSYMVLPYALHDVNVAS